LTFKAIGIASALYFVGFKLYARRKANSADTWYYIKYLNTYILLGQSSVLTMIQYPFTVLICFFYFIQMGVQSPLNPKTATANGCITPSSVLKAGFSLLWVIGAYTMTFLCLFGTVMA